MHNKHILTIDLEDYYNINGFCLEDIDLKRLRPRIEKTTNKLLDILDKYSIKATFFVLGQVAERFPELIKTIFNKGHEIASHGYFHKILYNSSECELHKEIFDSKKLLESIIKHPVSGFRAPSWSILRKDKKIIDLIKSAGYIYDSSLFPFKTWLYGSNRFKTNIRRLKNGLLEFPPSVIDFKLFKLPFSGGIFFRMMPDSIITYGINKNSPSVLYFHPWEIDKEQPRLKGNIVYRFIHYYGLSNFEDRLKILLDKYDLISIQEYIVSSLNRVGKY